MIYDKNKIRAYFENNSRFPISIFKARTGSMDFSIPVSLYGVGAKLIVSSPFAECYKNYGNRSFDTRLAFLNYDKLIAKNIPLDNMTTFPFGLKYGFVLAPQETVNQLMEEWKKKIRMKLIQRYEYEETHLPYQQISRRINTSDDMLITKKRQCLVPIQHQGFNFDINELDKGDQKIMWDIVKFHLCDKKISFEN